MEQENVAHDEPMAMIESQAQFIPSGSSSSTNNEMQNSYVNFIQYDPDDTPFTIKEWIEEVDCIRCETGMSDTLAILKAGQALTGRASKFYLNWNRKPSVRNWSTFCRDLETALSWKETPATRLESCMAITSSNFKLLVDYGHAKLNSIKKFYNGFPWEIISSLVAHNIVRSDVKNRIALQEPKDETELLMLLSSFDCDVSMSLSDISRKRPHQEKTERFGFKCRNCNKVGHKAIDCRMPKKRAPNSDSEIESCDFCKKKGHTEKKCWDKKRKIAGKNHKRSDSDLEGLIPNCNFCKNKGHTEDHCFLKNEKDLSNQNPVLKYLIN